MTDAEREQLKEEIKKLARERDAVILAHYYVDSDVQDIADFVGDSYALAKAAKSNPRKTVVFCGVTFMGESACILNPDKTVLVPAEDAVCPMALMADTETIREMREKYDQNSHLNPSGARKVTEAIGAYLSEHFDCDSHTAAAAYTQWHDDYEAYRSWLLSLIAQQTDFKKLLMMTNCSEVYANVTAGYGVTFDETEEKLLFKNGSDIRFTRSEETGQTISVTVFEQGTEREVTRMTLRIE